MRIRKLKKSAKPPVLTEAYQKLLDKRRFLETVRALGRGLAQADRGEGRPMRALLEELAGEHGTSPK